MDVNVVSDNDSVQSDHNTDNETEDEILLDANGEPVLVEIDEDEEEDDEKEGNTYGCKLID